MSQPAPAETGASEPTEPSEPTERPPEARQTRFIDRAYTEFTPIVGVPAVATAGFWLGAGASVEYALNAALAVLIVTAPVAAGIASRTVRMVVARRARRLGARLPRASALEVPRRVDVVVLVGAAALTDRAPELVAVHTADGVSEHTALRQAGAVLATVVEKDPTTDRFADLSRAVAAAVRTRFPDLPDAAETDRCGRNGARGIVAELDGDRVVAHAVLVGRPDLLTEHDITLDEGLTRACAAARAAGHIPLVVAWDGRARAVVELADPLLAAATRVTGQLRGTGFASLLMCDYDPDDARDLAAELGTTADSVTSVRSQVEQVAVVRGLQRDGHVVAVVGDPAAAAGALASADLPVAVGSSPAWGAITLDRPDPDTIVAVVRMARGITRTLGRNRWWVLGYTLTAVPLAAAGVLSPVAAVVATLAATGYVVMNSLLPYRC